MKNEDVRKFQGKNHIDNMSKDNNFPNGKNVLCGKSAIKNWRKEKSGRAKFDNK